MEKYRPQRDRNHTGGGEKVTWTDKKIVWGKKRTIKFLDGARDTIMKNGKRAKAGTTVKVETGCTPEKSEESTQLPGFKTRHRLPGG